MTVLDTVTHVDICPIISDSKYDQHSIVASIVFDHLTNEYFAKIDVSGSNSFSGITSLGHDYLAINAYVIHDALTTLTNCLDDEEEHNVIDFVVNELADAYTDILPV